MSRGASPAMFLPSNRISPESGASWPLIMLKQVDLPAPFGPIMARNSPCSTSKLTSLTARTPPKALDSERTVEHAHDAPLRLAPERREAADDALRERQHQQQDDAAEQRAPIFGLPHHGVLQRGEHRGADDRAGQRLDAAEQHHHQAVDRAADVDGLRRDRALGEGEQPAGDAADAAGNGKAEPVHALDVDADGLGAQRRIAAGAHGIAERREQKSPQQQHADHRQRQREQEIDPSPVERRRRPDADHAVGAAGQVLPLEHGRPDDLREGERQHREIDAGQPHREPAEQQRAGERDQRRRREREPIGAASHFTSSAAP